MNLAEILSNSCTQYVDKPALIFEGQKYTFRDVDEEVRRRSAWLHRIGVRKGDRVAIQLPKSMEFVFIHLGVLSIGAIMLPLNPDYPPEEVAYFVTDSGAFLFINDEKTFQKNRDFAKAIPRMKTFLINGTAPAGSGSLALELEKVGSEDPRTYPSQDDEVAMIIYTSGTTGKSKGAMITHRNLVSNMIALKDAWDWTDQDVLLHVLPLIHVHGLSVALHGGLHAGSTIIMHEKFDPWRVWRTLEEERCTLFMAVPTMYHRLLNEWDKVKPNLASMRVFISGSAPLSENLFDRFEKVAGFRILERYGMTEAGMIASNLIDVPGRKARSVGYPLPGVKIRIVSEEGVDVKPGEIGEAWIQGDNVFKGYWGMPEKTQASFDGRWFKTGDLGYQDPQDRLRLYLVGRAKELIITGGYNVYPKEIENVLEKHEAVQEAAVIGLPDEDYGERVTAIVVLKKDAKPVSAKGMIAHCRQHLASYKCPKEVFVVAHLPRNTMGKIQKNVLQKTYSKSSE